MYVILLTLLGASQLPAAAPPASSETELGTVEFPAGPARGTARFYLAGTEPRVDVTIHNDTPAPIWWRGAGIGCVSSHWIVAPIGADGSMVSAGFQGVACTMERSHPPSEQQLAKWAIAPGAAAANWTSRPFRGGEWPDEYDANVPKSIPRLDRWAWCHEFTMPRDTPPAESMDFEEFALVLAWNRVRGPRVYLEPPRSVHNSSFDPFESPPAADGSVPLRIGPLVGSARLVRDNGRAVIEWTLRNSSRRAIAWDDFPLGNSWDFGFLDQEPCDCDFGWTSDFGIIGRPAPALQPGETRSGSIAPFLDPVMGEPLCENPAHGPMRQRWHYVRDCRWPVAAEDGDLSGPNGWLHATWEERTGLRVWMSNDPLGADPGRARAKAPASPARRVGDGWFLARTERSDPRTLRLDVWPDWGEVHWQAINSSVPGEFRWIAPGREPLQPSRPRGGEAPPDWKLLRSEWLLEDWAAAAGKPGAREGDLAQESWEAHRTLDGFAPWEWERWVMVPRRTAPAHAHDYELARLRVTWDDEAGLDLSVVAVEPR